MPIPLPKDIRTQEQIINSLSEARKRASRKQEEASRFRDAAWNEFLAAVFQ